MTIAGTEMFLDPTCFVSILESSLYIVIHIDSTFITGPYQRDADVTIALLISKYMMSYVLIFTSIKK